MLQIRDWKLAVDVEKTKIAFDMNHYRCMSDECRNFIEASEKHLEPIVLDFAGELGIDLSKPSYLKSHRVNEDTAIMYSGIYHIIGEIIEGEIDAWDIVVGQHCFSLTDDMEQVPIMIDGPIIEISFEVVLPWVIENKVHV